MLLRNEELSDLIDILRTLIPCIRDMARRGRSALSVRIVLKA